MKAPLIKLIIILTIACSPLAARAQVAEAPLTNTAVIKLVRAGFKEKTVIAIIHNRPNRFVLDPDRLIELKRSGVSENIILAMLGHHESFVLADDDWIDDLKPKGSTGRPRDKDSKEPSAGSDIFGSSSGSRNQSNGRGMSGGNDIETATTGSATVRILRPPSEAGGTSLKLEKTPTLTNDSVVKLVEAGFSEGTIIKRIEDSPADFDLSVAKLEELRRRRVTEAIIMAMTAAMGESGPTQNAPGAGPSKAKGN